MEYNVKKKTERTLAITIVILVVITLSSSLLSHRLYSDNKKLRQEKEESKQVIITPMVNNASGQEYSFYGERGDSRYLRLMALSFISLRLDVNAQNVEHSHEILLSYTSNELREKLIPVLSQEKKSLSVDNGAATFYTRSIKVSPSNGIVDIKGALEFSYGIRKTPPVNKHYRLRIETINSKLSLTDFVEIMNEN